MVVLKNQNRRSGIFYLRPLCGFGFFSKSDFSAIFFSHFRSSTDSFLKFSLSRLQINAKYACSVSLSWLTISPAVSSISFSGLSSGTLKKSSLCVSRRARAIPFMSAHDLRFALLPTTNLTAVLPRSYHRKVVSLSDGHSVVKMHERKYPSRGDF